MAAGLGFKTFTTGEVLTAGDVNGYLMQGILVFASSAARTAAITSPQEGQYSYLKDTNALEYYDGAAWVGAPVGDITAVTAGTGLSGGGSSGDVTITNTMATAIDAKGDLVAGTGADTFSRLAVGTNGQFLTADSTASTGLKWSTVSTSPNYVGCCVYNNGSNFSFTANTAQIQSFTLEDFDTNGFHDNSTNTSRLTIPTGYAGKYLINTQWRLGVGVGYVITYIYKNGSGTGNGMPGGEIVRVMNQGSNSTELNGSVVMSLAVGDYIEMVTQTDITSTTPAYIRFSASYLGA